MRRLPYQSFFLMVMISTLIILAAPTPGRADVGVHPILPGGSSLQPEKRTSIQMASEVVTMNVRLATPADNTAITLNPAAYGYQSENIWYPAAAEVQADFRMLNPTLETVTMTVWFPLASYLKEAAWLELNPDEIVPRIEQFSVSVNGAPIGHQVSMLPNPYGADKPDLPWASFPVTFAAEGETNLRVEYVLPLAQPAKSSELVLYYIFQTGASWAGTIGQAELILNLPYPASVETLSGVPPSSLRPPYFIYFGEEIVGIPAGAELDGNQARWTWQDWEPGPEDDFAILLMHPKTWEDLQANRAAVEKSPGDGQAWWKLCQSYLGLSRPFHAAIKPAFSETFRSLGIQACQEAARLLPGDAAPHYVLAWYFLRALEENPSLETLEPVMLEWKLAEALEAVQTPSDVTICPFPWDLINSECIEVQAAEAYPNTPDAAWTAGIMEAVNQRLVQEFSDATATVIAIPTATLKPSATATPTAMPTSTASSTASPSATWLASPTHQPTAPPAQAEPESKLPGILLWAALCAAGLVAARTLVRRKLRLLK
jgi:hypothetical protein